MASTISAGTTAGTAVAITGDTTGNLSLLTQNGANTITVPNGTGTMAVNGVSSNIVAGTAVASTSGTSIDFTGIPSWVKRITVMFNGVSLSGSANGLVQIGSGSVTTSGYLSGATVQYVGAIEAANATNGYVVGLALSSRVTHGSLVLTLISGNTWVASGSFGFSNAAGSATSGGTGVLSGALDRVRITTTNGTDTFDAGSINILYE